MSHPRCVPLRLLPLAPVLFALAACGEPVSGTAPVERETLADGRVLVTYPSSPAIGEDTVTADLRIGVLDGDPAYIFGDVRGIEVSDDGTIYVLDHPTSEVRAFTADGTHLSTLTRSGRGPGEIAQANGLAFGPDGTLWINDHGSRVLVQLDTEGRELSRYPQIVPGYAYLWTGSVDSMGILHEQWGHSDRDRPMDLTRTGLLEATSRGYYKSFDPTTEAYDSVHLGTARVRAYVAAYDRGQISMRLPFAPTQLAAADRSGMAWVGLSDTYSLVRIDEAGDTLLVLRVAEAPPPITEADLDEWRLGLENAEERVPGLTADIEPYVPKTKPILTRLVTDDEGRLWVGRTVPAGEAARYDVFDDQGEFLASVRLFDGTAAYSPPVIRRGRVYALVMGELDEQYVVAGDLPDVLRP